MVHRYDNKSGPLTSNSFAHAVVAIAYALSHNLSEVSGDKETNIFFHASQCSNTFLMSIKVTTETEYYKE